jgi:hypothetical protein
MHRRRPALLPRSAMTKSSVRSRKTAPAKSASNDRQGLAPPREERDDDTARTEEAAPTMLPADAADYIAQMTAELARIARTAKLDPLAYFLEMARIEATTCLRWLQGGH